MRLETILRANLKRLIRLKIQQGNDNAVTYFANRNDDDFENAAECYRAAFELEKILATIVKNRYQRSLSARREKNVKIFP